VVGAIIPSQTTQAQPSGQDLANLIHLIEREKVKAAFPESSLSPKVADAIASQTGASADYTLYGDTLGPAGSSGATYVQMEEANADAMVRGFTGGRTDVARARASGLGAGVTGRAAARRGVRSARSSRSSSSFPQPCASNPLASMGKARSGEL
jgi:hypothetical protein